jgi:hypothetical protein
MAILLFRGAQAQKTPRFLEYWNASEDESKELLGACAEAPPEFDWARDLLPSVAEFSNAWRERNEPLERAALLDRDIAQRQAEIEATQTRDLQEKEMVISEQNEVLRREIVDLRERIRAVVVPDRLDQLTAQKNEALATVLELEKGCSILRN